MGAPIFSKGKWALGKALGELDKSSTSLWRAQGEGGSLGLNNLKRIGLQLFSQGSGEKLASCN